MNSSLPHIRNLKTNYQRAEHNSWLSYDSKLINHLNSNVTTGYPLVKKTLKKDVKGIAQSFQINGSCKEVLNEKTRDESENISIKNSVKEPKVHSARYENGTLPRIIKPRKRRKKDRKPTNNFQHTENVSTFPFTFSSSTKVSMQNLSTNNDVCVNENNNNIQNFQDNCSNPTATYSEHASVFSVHSSFQPENFLSSSVSSSPMSLSNSSLSNSSYNYRLGNTNYTIWCFPLKRSCSSQSASSTESEKFLSTSVENEYNERNIKNVGVIGSNRSKPKELLGNTLETDKYQNHQTKNTNKRNSSQNSFKENIIKDSCASVLNNLQISDDIISSTINTVNDTFSFNFVDSLKNQLLNLNLSDRHLFNNNIDPT